MAGWRTSRIENLPPDFVALYGKTQYLHRASASELAGSCPKCGGSPHENGELPDRFRLFLIGKPRAWCRHCGYMWFPNNDYNADRVIADISAWQSEREAAEQRRKSEAERALELLEREKRWLTYHESMSEEQKKLWDKVGIPREWQEFWKLGYTSERPFMFADQQYSSPALVIPKFDIGWKPTNIDFRLLNAPVGAGKYRPLTGLPASFFIANPQQSLDTCEEIIIVEGSKKAMIVSIYADKEFRQVLGIPGCSSWAGVEERVKQCPKIWIMLDPGAECWAHKMAMSIGENAHVIELPAKPDDALLMYGATRKDFHRFLLQAMRPCRQKVK